MLAAYGAAAPGESFAKARASATRALELDDRLAEAHTALAYAKFRGEFDWAGAEREFKRAIELNYDYAQAHQWYGNYLVARGRADEALEEARRTLALDPTSLIIQSHHGFINFFAHRYDDAIRESQKTLRLDPNFFAARRYMGLSYTQKGMHAQAIAEFEKAVVSGGGSPILKAEYAHSLARAGKEDEARRLLNELLEQSKQRYVSAYHIATIYAGLAEQEKALDWLERAYEERADYLAYINVDPRLYHLHGEARFDALLVKLGF
jgi:tetratricopeptide (TPR) repeat protein